MSKPAMLKVKYGFTLIELLVVISIIGILAGLTLVSFTAAQKQTRDTQRQSDLKQYQNLLEAYASTNRGLYPNRILPEEASRLCNDIANGVLPATNCPQDPSGTSWDYLYISDGTPPPPYNNRATRFVLWAYQEATGRFFVICSEGDTGTTSIEPNDDACPELE
jgi:prepilin-type N-terminal cleavage/methylation domain-containing protein